MKKIIVLATLLLIASTVSAQTYFNNARADYDMFFESKFGIQLSGNLAGATKSTNFNTSNIAGFTAGVNMDFPVSYPISVVPALLYSYRGFSANTPAGSYTQRTQSVDIPVLAKFKSGSSLNFFLGPQMSYIISNTNQFDQKFSDGARSAYQYAGSKLRMQGVAGLGLDVNRSLSLHTRYTFDINSTARNGNDLSPTYRMQSWQFGFGVNI
jgi:hypothetical protein